jgi:hypothetical protein
MRYKASQAAGRLCSSANAEAAGGADAPTKPQIESMYNDFEGKTVVDLGCGTVRPSGFASGRASPAAS